MLSAKLRRRATKEHCLPAALMNTYRVLAVPNSSRRSLVKKKKKKKEACWNDGCSTPFWYKCVVLATARRHADFCASFGLFLLTSQQTSSLPYLVFNFYTITSTWRYTTVFLSCYLSRLLCMFAKPTRTIDDYRCTEDRRKVGEWIGVR